jgi:DNA helicase-2/ATP-dependent DNA helicase PcrA
VTNQDLPSLLLAGLTDQQAGAVRSEKRRLLIIAGAGSGKTEVMARRVAWWVGVEGVPKDAVVAFTFTDRAAEEMKFRIRQYIQAITPDEGDATLGGMYIGTIHSYCLKLLRELRPEVYHNYDIVDDIARVALVQRCYDYLLGLRAFQQALSIDAPISRSRTIQEFLRAYDLLNEYNELDVSLPESPQPDEPGQETEWCKQAVLVTDVGESEAAEAFERSAARFYAYLRCRHFLDFSTSQSELVRLLAADPDALGRVRETVTHVVVDEVQDVNPVQDQLVRAMVGDHGTLTAVGDHRQAIFAWRGGRIDIMAQAAEEFLSVPDGDVVELTHNFRSTPRIIELSNRWNHTIGVPGSMASPDMEHGRSARVDLDRSHIAALRLPDRAEEAAWIADTIARLVRSDGTGALHDSREGERGLTFSDVAILLRSSTDARTYMTVLRNRGIPAVVRAGPDLFSQPEVLLFAAALAVTAGIDRFMGGPNDPRALPNRIANVLGVEPTPAEVIMAACRTLADEGIPLEVDAGERLLLGAELIAMRTRRDETRIPRESMARLRTPELRDWITRNIRPRRVFPQALFHLLLAEAGVERWDCDAARATAAMFHLGQLSSLVTGIETPGWTSPREYPYQIQALLLWGTQNARSEEAPLLVTPDAVSISTIHSAKGLEFAAVFLADVCANRFPSSRARREPGLPFDGPITARIDEADLVDNENYDHERRLMYVALTRAERYLFVSASGRRQSRFFRAIPDLVSAAGGVGDARPAATPAELEYISSEPSRESRLVTSFSDLRYYLECPHDFYLRKVLGFTPTIDQAFGYGRGVHNLLREVHSDPKSWAELARNPEALQARLWELIRRGLFYLRHTVGQPADNMKSKAVRILADYVGTYADELSRLTFEPEREFETLIEEQQVLVSGAIDVIRLDDPPRVTIIDFKSGEPESDARMSLDEDEMRLQVSMYGLAARHELEYDPDRGLVRYLGEEDPELRQLDVELDNAALAEARALVAETAGSIRSRRFASGPRRSARRDNQLSRCGECDFLGICGMAEAKAYRSSS